jgi:hypothetical protein
MDKSIEEQIAHKLESSADSVRAIRSRGPVGRASVAGLSARLGLDPTAPLGEQLAARGILTAAEGAWLDGATGT